LGSGVTTLYFSDTGFVNFVTNIDLDIFLDSVYNGTTITIEDPSTGNKWVYQANANSVDNGTYHTVSVTYVAGPTATVSNNQLLYFTFQLVGGSSGTSGTSGTSVAVGGTPNQVVKFTGSTAIGDSSISDDGTTITLGDVTEVDVNTGTMDGQGSASLLNFSAITAVSKSFDITHPTKGEPWRLQYGNLEGPEHGVYFRGRTLENVIDLPNYWTGLVDESSISVQLTPIGKPCQHYVEKVENNKVYINCLCGEVDAYYLVQAERRDVKKVLLEYKPSKE
jgi:hypothetical protein